MLSLLRQWLYPIRQPLPKEVLDDIAFHHMVDCKDCHRIIGGRGVLRLMTHLSDHHKLEDTAAQEMAVHVFSRVKLSLSSSNGKTLV